MMRANSQLNESEIKRYLFAEVSDEERRTIEEQIFLDDELFFEIVNLENELVDLFAKNKLEGEELTRFQLSLEKLPERRQKAANAVALQTFIAEDRPPKISAEIPAARTFWQKSAEFFTVKTPAFSYAVLGLLVLFTIATGFLWLQNERQSGELARLENERGQYEQTQNRQDELQNQLAGLRQREIELQKRIDSERETTGDLTDELTRERQSRRRIEGELNKLKQQSNASRPNAPETPTIATITLKPGITRGGENLQKLDATRTTKRVAVQLSLPAETGIEERFSVRLNEKFIDVNLKARVAAGGQKNIQLTVSSDDLRDGENKLAVINQAGAEVSVYFLTFKK